MEDIKISERKEQLDICKFCLEAAIVDVETRACDHCINETE